MYSRTIITNADLTLNGVLHQSTAAFSSTQSFQSLISLLSAMIIPQRYVLGIMGLFALGNSFTMRVCLSMTITQMVLHAETSEHIIGETCPDPNGVISNTTDDDNNTVSVIFTVSVIIM